MEVWYWVITSGFWQVLIGHRPWNWYQQPMQLGCVSEMQLYYWNKSQRLYNDMVLKDILDYSSTQWRSIDDSWSYLEWQSGLHICPEIWRKKIARGQRRQENSMFQHTILNSCLRGNFTSMSPHYSQEYWRTSHPSSCPPARFHHSFQNHGFESFLRVFIYNPFQFTSAAAPYTILDTR